ncbi:FtsK/SpoIIIE domain-containing protein [Arthrobacter sp. CG_A4]|uniref:FtsK/SpoIIIE domain-containing protein n=1 Tax=Arthrobacter sp. CG_A4 TaxID=3071706 RepID=UPI002DFB2E81|nr:S-DNA-T family DNA segregation ATPase FtsK/SpoIIIE [Arthrobacter sp. CG_A4]
MILHCTLVPAPGSALAPEPLELALDLPRACSGAELQSAVSRHFGTGALTVEGAPLVSMTVGEPPLVHGAILVDGCAPRRNEAVQGAAPLLLAVHSGPGAGMIIPLRRGRFRIGRSGTEIVIPDAELSREHARLDVSDSAVTLVDLDSANGTAVDGRRVRASPVTTASSIRCGNSSLSLIFTGSTDAGVPASAGCGVAEPLLVRNDSASANRGVLLATAIVPLAIGIGLAVITGMWMFLAFTAVSAVSLLVPVVSGRRQRRELKTAVAAAAREDQDRRRRSAPSAAELALHGTAVTSDARQSSPPPTPVWLRLGLAEQTANVRLEPPGSAIRSPPLGLMPVTLDPTASVTTIRGPEPAVAGLVRAFLMQLACYPLARRTRVLVHGPTRFLPLCARFLAAVTLSGHEAVTLEALAAGPGRGYDLGLLIIVDGSQAPALCAAAVGHGWRVIECGGLDASAHSDPAASQSVVLGERTGVLTSDRLTLDFIPDRVPGPVFDRSCRRLAGPVGPAGPGDAPTAAIPEACALAEILTLTTADTSRRWAQSARSRGLPVLVGVGGAGPLRLDLQADGPHFLVAGTTGSGKSEFLRTLAVALAACHPPDRLNLLFIDFKGGSGLGSLTGLPHCVGLLTDLGTDEVARTLVSLRAEVRRREELLAACGAPDLEAYEDLNPPGLPLPHLVVIIDEFRMLVNEAPEALSELMRIAAIGRALGLHLVMATQRPQGAITADIRANVTSCIALRVQSQMESIDIMNSRLAATIPIEGPGRAYLVRGNEEPEEFQTATVTPAVPEVAIGVVSVMPAADFLCRRPASDSSHVGAAAAPTPSRALAPFIEATTALWEALGSRPPRRPVADPLPATVAFPTNPLPAGVSREPVRLGRLDLPEEQRTAELSWSAAQHGHLGLVGGGPGGTDAAMALAVEQLLWAEQESHLYLLDAAGTVSGSYAGSFSGSTASPRIGAAVGVHELRRAVRVLERLAGEVTRRLSTGADAGSPPLILVLGGWGSWISAFRAGPLAWAEDLVHDIVRDGPAAGITVIASGERELVTARFFAAIPNRLYFPAGTTEEGRLAWPRLPSLDMVPGRMVAFGPFAEGSSTAGHIGQLFEAPVVRQCPTPEVRSPPFRVEPLPPRVTVPEVLARAGKSLQPEGPSARGLLCVGIGGDELRPAGVQLPPGSVLAVLGAPGSGKSSLLSALPGLNPAARWQRPAAGAEPGQYWSGIYARALAGTLDRTSILLADDLDLQSTDTNRQLLALNSLGWTVILTAGFSQALQQRAPLALHARSHGNGILIAPRSQLDGDLFGVRVDLEHNPPPGRAVVISDGRAITVQLAVDPGAGGGKKPP